MQIMSCRSSMHAAAPTATRPAPKAALAPPVRRGLRAPRATQSAAAAPPPRMAAKKAARAVAAAAGGASPAASFDAADLFVDAASVTERPSSSRAAAAAASQQQQQRQQPRPQAASDAATSSTSSSTSTSNNTNSSSSSMSSTRAAAQEQELAALSAGGPVQSAEARLTALAGWLLAAAAFGAGVWAVQGPARGQEFFAGYLLEQSLSVDNLFVFVLVFSYFQVPAAHQRKVLGWGIGSAAALRAVMILLGTELVGRFEPVLVGFAVLLLWSAYGLVTSDSHGDDGDLSDNKVVKLCRRLLPVSDHYDGDRFWTTGPDGARLATPLLLALAVIELSDVVFAVDSIPAVFGVTRDPFIVYTSNIFAILSLRALYAFVSTVMTELKHLDKAVAAVLAFIGAKMLAEFGGAEVPTSWSLGFVGAALGAGVAASVWLPGKEEEEEQGGDKAGSSGDKAGSSSSSSQKRE